MERKGRKYFARASRVPLAFGAAWYGYSPRSLGNPALHERLKVEASQPPAKKKKKKKKQRIAGRVFSSVSYFNRAVIAQAV
jgi:hypothetical protein